MGLLQKRIWNETLEIRKRGVSKEYEKGIREGALIAMKIVDEMRQEFPVEFWWAVIEEDESGETVEEQEIMPNAKLPENRANARIRKDKVIDWLIKWLI